MQPGSTRVVKRMIEAAALAMALAMVGSGVALGAAPVDDLEPPTPAAFLPGGLLGVQLGGSWEDSKKSKSLRDLACETGEPQADIADEVCFFKSPAASQVGGAEVHDGFIVRKGDRPQNDEGKRPPSITRF